MTEPGGNRLLIRALTSGALALVFILMDLAFGVGWLLVAPAVVLSALSVVSSIHVWAGVSQ